MSSLSFNDFIETVILPDLVEKYESIIFPYLENFDRNFNDVYDAALVDRGEYPFNKTEAAKELYDLQMHGTYNKIHPTFREIIESCCDKFDDERTIAIARDPDNAYLSGFMSSYKL